MIAPFRVLRTTLAAAMVACACRSTTAALEKVMGEPGSGFGYSVAAAADVLVVGAPSEDGALVDSGAVHVYQLSSGSWILQQSIQPDAAAYAEFGSAVALDGDTLAVGAWGDSRLGENAGAVYLYRFDGATWSQEAELRASGGQPWDSFGAAVALSGGTLLVGVPGDSEKGIDAGSVHVYKLQSGSWVESRRLYASDAGAHDLFGWAVAFDGTSTVIGAWANDVKGTESGAAYVFRQEGAAWIDQGKLTASDGDAFDMFGAAVDISNKAIVIGAYLHQHDVLGAGAVYVFRFDGISWVQESELAPDAAVEWGLFGHAVGIEGDRVLVGYPGDTANGESSGSARMYWFDGHSWRSEDSVVPADGQANAMCGWAVTLSDRYAAVGAWEDDNGNGSDAGAVYVGDVGPLPRELIANDGMPGDHFGNDVALDADWAVIGARRVSDQGAGSGAVYAFRHTGDQAWRQEQKLIPSDATTGDRAGYAVDVSGTTIIVGSRLHDDQPGDNAGAAYAFEWDGSRWEEAAKLLAPDLMPGDQFGCAAAVDLFTAVVGAWQHGVEDAGAVYVFERQLGGAWTGTATLLPDPPGGRFGGAVDLAGDIIIVGSEWDDETGVDAGAAYVFRKTGNTWVREDKLVGSGGGGDGAYYGCAVAIDKDIIVIGARLSDLSGIDAGCAYVYRHSNGQWEHEATLFAVDAGAGDEFGTTVAVYGDTVIVGANLDDDRGTSSGSTYAFEFDGNVWHEAEKLVPPDGAELAQFGSAVSIWGRSILVGAFGDSSLGSQAGAAYIYGKAIVSSAGAHWISNRHRYQRFIDDTDWPDAAAMAAHTSYGGSAGYLVTITRQAEQDFVVGSLGGEAVRRHWLGGIQPDPGSLPDEGWTWVTGEPWAYTNWSSGEPNDFSGSEDVLSFSNVLEPPGGWNDTARDAIRPGFVVEYPPLCPPDFNVDDQVDSRDVIAFLNAWVVQDPAADFNQDGSIDTRDVIAFLNSFVAGC